VANKPPPDRSVGAGSSLRIAFAAGSAKLDKTADAELRRVSGVLKKDDALRIQLLAYAGAIGNSSSQARRLSLSRALAARSALIGQGIKSTRIDVRALGNRPGGGPADRVDIIVTKR
jgi:outer membrane protein OmpA-like peptidoglycan-associated protein